VADIRLSYDLLGQRWEGFVVPADQWSRLQDVTSLLTIARDARGDLAGFIFDFDADSPDFTTSLRQISELFGDEVHRAVSSPSSGDSASAVVPISTSMVAIQDDEVLFPVLGSVNARARDISIVEDRSNGIIRVSMRLPWWAAFLRPWVTVRRRGRTELIALGALHRSGGVHTAELHYGLPAPASSLVAEVIRGNRAAWITGLVASGVTTLLILGGLALIGSDDATNTVVAPDRITSTTVASATSTSASVTTSSSSTIPATSTTIPVVDTTLPAETSVPATSTTKPPRNSNSPATTLLPTGGVNFTLPSQYITANDIRADVSVDRLRVKRGRSLNVSVRISAVFINPFDRGGINTLPDLVAACQSIIGVDLTVPPTPGWTTSVSVSLAGTSAFAGGYTQLVVVGNRATECGDVLTNNDPARIDVVRTTFFREVPMTLEIPKNLRPGSYQLVFNAIPYTTLTKATPLEITVVE
jgi:hypothetical protein